MQSHFLSASILVLTLAATAPAVALVPELPVCGSCSADAEIGTDGGVWRSRDTDGTASEAPSQVQTPPAEASVDYYIALGGVDGESTEDPHRDRPPQQAPAQTGQDLSSGQPQALIGMLVPAVQKVRDAASRAGGPHDDGVVVLDSALPAGAAAARGTGTLTLSNGNGSALVPEMPICANCGADAQVQAQQQAAPEERPQRRRAPNFSFSIGGVSIGSGGVSVAAGDVDGDGRGESRRRPERRSDGRR